MPAVFNSQEKTRVTYTGPALPGNAEVIIMFSTTVAFGPRCAPHYRMTFIDIATQTDQGSNTLQLQKSTDGGVTWVAVGAATAVGTGHVLTQLYVTPYADWRVVYTNGATPQGLFNVDIALRHA